MEVKDFIHEEITECDIDFDFYILYMQTECDDIYYPSYKTNIGIFKSKENAIEYTRKKFYKMAEKYTSSEDRKYGGVEGLFYIEGDYFEDNDVDRKETGEKKKKCDKRLYIIYDKEEQDKINARWNKMHAKYC